MPGFWIYLDLCGLSGHSSLLHNRPADGQGLNIYILYTSLIIFISCTMYELSYFLPGRFYSIVLLMTWDGVEYSLNDGDS